MSDKKIPTVEESRVVLNNLVYDFCDEHLEFLQKKVIDAYQIGRRQVILKTEDHGERFQGLVWERLKNSFVEVDEKWKNELGYDTTDNEIIVKFLR